MLSQLSCFGVKWNSRRPRTGVKKHRLATAGLTAADGALTANT